MTSAAPTDSSRTRTMADTANSRPINLPGAPDLTGQDTAVDGPPSVATNGTSTPTAISTRSASVDVKELKHQDSEARKRKDKPLLTNVRSGHFSMQGIRAEMEDKVTVLPHPEFNRTVNQSDPYPRSFFAVFDGHGGDVSAEYCHLHVHMNLASDSYFHADPAKGLFNALIKTDADFCAACRRIHLQHSSGTTAITALIDGDTLIIGNVGDSRAVLCRSGRPVAVSIDHKPNRPEERQRIEACGGRVGTTEGEAFGRIKVSCCDALFKCCGPTRPLRVFPGGLSVSRTIGDIGLKTGNLIIAEPEIWQGELTEEDNFLILACDGVWDVMSSQQAVDLVKKHTGDAEEAAKVLAKDAYRRGSTDNISVVIVVFEFGSSTRLAP